MLRSQIIGLLALGLLAGCSTYSQTKQDDLTGYNANARAIGGGPDYVDVEVEYTSWVHQIETVELVAPDGRRFAANDVSTTVESNQSAGAQPFGTIGIGGGSGGGVGFGIGFGYLFGATGGGVQSAPTVRGKAAIQVSDTNAYRRDYQRWVVAVTLSRGGTEPQTFTLQAPPPS